MKYSLRAVFRHLIFAGLVMFLATSCKKNESTDPIRKDLIPKYGEPVYDIDGNVYKTVVIGTQTWMAENLKTNRYRNGDSIVMVTDDKEWIKLTTGARCYYSNDSAKFNKYGNIYNWYAVNDERNIAPIGWHIPSDEEWTTLTTFILAHLSRTNTLTRSLASATKDWIPYKSYYAYMDSDVLSNNISKNNSSGFNGLPGGIRDYNGEFTGVGRWTGWWSSTEVYGDKAWDRNIDVMGVTGQGSFKKEIGFYVRCIKN